MRVAVIGVGALGARAARQLASTEGVDLVLVDDVRPKRLAEVAASLGPRGAVLDGSRSGFEVAILAGAPGSHGAEARRLLEGGASVVSTSDSIDDVVALLDLDAEAIARGRCVVAGAGFSPGLTCLLARHAAARCDHVDELHIARAGTGGPACARQHHDALAGTAVDWRDGGWLRRRAGSGRELVWFPEPIGPRDCYRAELPEALLLVPAFPGVVRVTARLAANRRDRVTAQLPMLRRPHPDGGLGAARVEVRGHRGRSRVIDVLGAMDSPALAGGAVAAVAAAALGRGELLGPGAAGLAAIADPLPLLTELARRGVKAATYEGA